MADLSDMLKGISDPTGIKQLYDMVSMDTAAISELDKQEKEGKPIDIERAKAVIANIDQFMEEIGKLPWTFKMMIGFNKLKKMQEQAHQHLKILEEKSKVQGVVVHTQDPSAKMDSTTPTGIEMPAASLIDTKVSEVTNNPLIDTDVHDSLRSTIMDTPVKESIPGSTLPDEAIEEMIIPPSEPHPQQPPLQPPPTEVPREKETVLLSSRQTEDKGMIKTVSSAMIERESPKTKSEDDSPVLPEDVNP